MNIGLILLLGSFLVGADKENSEKPTEQPKSNNEKISLNEMVVSTNDQDDLSETKPNNKEPIRNKNLSPSIVNRAPSIRGEPEKTIKQDEHYSFIVQASDPENDELNFAISNKPNWAIFDSLTGALFGQPNNFDIGISKNIVISVLDQFGGKSSLMPFNIEVINVNDKPTISGIPSTFLVGKPYRFTPKAKDMDVDVGKDKLIFSIKNKPKWAKFNAYTGELTGIPKGIISDSDEIVITVTDSLGESDSLSPFYLRASSLDNLFTDEDISPRITKNIASSSIANNTGQFNISSSLHQGDSKIDANQENLDEDKLEANKSDPGVESKDNKHSQYTASTPVDGDEKENKEIVNKNITASADDINSSSNDNSLADKMIN